MNSGKALLLLSIVAVVIFSCKPKNFDEPIISLNNYHIAEGFEMKVIASEPFLDAPVTMDFDNQGRMWVAEMKGYMMDLNGKGEDTPNGTISIMEDLDNDGITDHSKVFMDSLVLPRAIAHVYNGLLYAVPPNLWFVEIENDKPKNKVLVDASYSDGGNVEHQPNGLMMNIDNWIYNAKSNFRYQLRDGKWIKEPTSFRGQWGISKDNYGRLYYNNNSVQLFGDYVLPNTNVKNPYFQPDVSIGNVLTENQRVYPLHATSVNRGYQKGVLDKDSLLINVTSACGPVIYRGSQFPEEYSQNAFVCVPEVNLIKRNILTFYGDSTVAKQAKENVEFLASTDEGFRPVNLFNGPDGAMYVVDMHRGIIQYKAYLTPYLQKHLEKKQLDTIIGMGRILKIKSKNKSVLEFPDFDQLSTLELVDLLNSPNGWVRDRVQHLLVYKQDKEAIPSLKELVYSKKDKPITQIHALHTLNGLNALSFNFLEDAVKGSQAPFIAHTLVLLEDFATKNSSTNMSDLVLELVKKDDLVIDLYLANSLGKWTQHSNELFFPILADLSKTYNEDIVYQEGIMSSLRENESAFSNYLKSNKLDAKNSLICNMLKAAIVNRERDIKNSIYTTTNVKTDGRTSGYLNYRSTCATCHGLDGNGIQSVAPPLKNSEYVDGPIDRLGLIVLHGLQGPIHVNGKRYEFNGAMPSIANNKDLSDSDIANIINYLQKAFAHSPKSISSGKIKALRNQKPANGAYFTEKELLELNFN